MTGLQRICKLYGRMKCGDVLWLWDYVQNKARPASEMTKAEKMASEKARWVNLVATNAAGKGAGDEHGN